MARKPRTTNPDQPAGKIPKAGEAGPLLAALEKAQQEAHQARAGKATESFREHLEAFPLAPNYIWGRHTRATADALNDAVEGVAAGRSSYLTIAMHPRAGKSDLSSRGLPPWALLKFPDLEIILATYGADLSEGFSRVARRRFQEAAPKHGLAISDELNQAGAWAVKDHRGAMYAIGLGGAVTGRGASILIIDDYCKNREEAESPAIRDKVWDSFRNDLFTRLAPVHAVIIVATRWHEDDLVGRLKVEMAKDPEFPRFQELRFPAINEDGSWLFPERYPAAWYQAQQKAAGIYGWQSLFMCDPQPRQGRFLRGDLMEIVPVEKWPFLPDGKWKPELQAGRRPVRWVRYWDLASTAEQLAKDDPDSTVGTKTGFDGETDWVRDQVCLKASAVERDNRIVQTAEADGPGVTQFIEVVAGYKDTFKNVQQRLRGKARVIAVTQKIGKDSRWERMAPKLESGCVKLLAAPWNRPLIDETCAVPKGKHDDKPDSLEGSIDKAEHQASGGSGVMSL